MKKSDKKTDRIDIEVGETVKVNGETDVETVMDKLTELGVTKGHLYPEGNPDVDEEEEPIRLYRDTKFVKIPVIVFVDKDHKSLVMLKELALKEHIDVITQVPNVNLGQILKKLKSEKEQGNIYNIAYLPFSNDDCNKDQSKVLKEIEKLNHKIRNELELNTVVYPYFSDREDAEIATCKE